MRRVLQGDRLIYIRPTPHHPSGAPLHHHIHPTVRAHRCGKTLGRFPLQPAGGSLRFATLPFVVAGAGGRAYLGAPRGAPCLRAPLGPSAPAPYHGFRRKNQNNKESHPPPLRFLTCKTYVAREISAQPTQPNRGMREADDRKSTKACPWVRLLSGSRVNKSPTQQPSHLSHPGAMVFPHRELQA
jgi:hypothetical protein